VSGPRHRIDNITELSINPSHHYYFGWRCHTCGHTDGAYSSMERDDQKEAHQALAQNNLIPHPVDMKELHLVSAPLITTATDLITVCGGPAGCVLSGHTITTPIGVTGDSVRRQMPDAQKRVFELEHQLEATRAVASEQTKAGEDELGRYKEKVRNIAQRYARENGWCETVNEALEEMGIDPDAGVRWFNVSFWMSVRVRGNAEDLDRKIADSRNGYGSGLSLTYGEDEDGDTDRSYLTVTQLDAEEIVSYGPPRIERYTADRPAGV
jgi:hypothetical protein